MSSTDNSARIADIPEPFRLRNIQIFLEANNHEKTLGGSTSAPVLEIKLRGLKCVGQSLIRRRKDRADDQIGEDWGRLEEVCKILSKVRHPNIVLFLGVYYNEKEMPAPILVMEFLPTNLTSCIEQYGILPKEISYSILHDVALGLCYLHSQTPPIIHRDLYSNNVLLTSNMTAKISDLGKAKILSMGTKLSQIRASKNFAKISFIPPEAMKANPQYDTSIDEFSYGIIMIHVFSGQWPEPQVASVRTEPDPEGPGEMLIPMSEAERREGFLQAIGDDHPLMDLILKCINNYPQGRAQASEIVGRLAEMVLEFPASFANRLEMLKQIECCTCRKKDCEILQDQKRHRDEGNESEDGSGSSQGPPPKKHEGDGLATNLSQDNGSGK